MPHRRFASGPRKVSGPLSFFLIFVGGRIPVLFLLFWIIFGVTWECANVEAHKHKATGPGGYKTLFCKFLQLPKRKGSICSMHPEPILGRRSDAWSWTLQTMSLLPQKITNDWNLRKTCQKRLEPKIKRLLLGRKTKKKQHLQTSKQPSFGVPESPAVKKAILRYPFFKKTRQPPSDAETSHCDSPFEQIEFHLGQSIVSVQRSLKWAPSFFVSEKKAAAKNSNTAEASMCFFWKTKSHLQYLIESPREEIPPDPFATSLGFLFKNVSCSRHTYWCGRSISKARPTGWCGYDGSLTKITWSEECGRTA